MAKPQSYRIILEYSVATGTPITPWDWDWHHLLDIHTGEAVTMVACANIDTPPGHLEDLEDVSC